MKRAVLTTLAVALVTWMLGSCDNPASTTTTQSIVTGVTITGTGVTGSGGNKELTVTIGTPVELDVTVTKSGSPSLTETWSSADTNTVTVTSAGLVSGVVASTTGVVVTVTVGGKSDTILVKVVAAVQGLTLGFDTDKLEFKSLDTTAAAPTAPTVVKSAANVITLKNTDGTFKHDKDYSTQGTSLLLYKNALTGDFQVQAAVKIVTSAVASDRIVGGVGFLPVNASGAIATTDTKDKDGVKWATLVKRTNNTIRSMWSKANSTTGWIGAGSPNLTLTNTDLASYHILTVKRVGTKVTFDSNGTSADVTINTTATNDGVTNTTGEIWSTLSGSVKAGLVVAGAEVEVEGFSVSSLKADGTVDTVLYSQGSLPSVTIPVTAVALKDAGGATSSTRDVVGKSSSSPDTLQLTATVSPSSANSGTAITYSVKDSGDTNVTVSTSGLVSITGVGDGSATIVATSANSVTGEYVLTLTDSSLVVSSVTIASTLDIAVGQEKTLTATVAPTTASDKSVTWTSNNTAISVDSTGKVTVAAGTATGTTGKITAKSVNNVVSNECTVTVVAPAGTPTTYTFPNANWGVTSAGVATATTLLAQLLNQTATSWTTNFNLLASATLNSADGLSYKSSSAGQLRFRYDSVNGNAINYNGASFTGSLGAVGSAAATGATSESSFGRYISIPLSAVTSTNVKVDVVWKGTTSAVTNAVALVGNDAIVLAKQAVTDSSTVTTLTWTGAKASLTNLLVIFSREGGASGGIDIRSITVTPQ